MMYLNSNTINEIVDKVIQQVLTEANNNLSFKDFLSDCKKLGLTIKDTDSGKSISYGDTVLCCTHEKHGASKQNKADTLRDIVAGLAKIGWFNNAENHKRFPWTKWGFNPDKYWSEDTETKAILLANNQYADAKVYPVFNMKDSICVLKREETPCFNLCRSSHDRRPIYDEWFDEYDIKTLNNQPIPVLSRDNYEEFQTEIYPINPDGSMGDVILESKFKSRGLHMII